MNRTWSCRYAIRGALGVLLAASLLAAPGQALAQVSASDKALAQALFEKGRELMDAGNFEDACPKLADSQRLDPGGGTLLNLGICLEKAGKTASAWATFEEALTGARQDGRADRENFAQKRIEALKPMLSHVVIELTPAGDIPGIQIQLNGNPMSRTMMNGPWDAPRGGVGAGQSKLGACL